MQSLAEILNAVRSGALTVDAAEQAIAALNQSEKSENSQSAREVAAPGFADLDFARIDTARANRRGFPETVFCPGKTGEQIVAIMRRFQESESLVLASRATPEQAEAVMAALPETRYFADARLLLLGAARRWTGAPDKGKLLVLSAGTADHAVAEEAARTAEIFGANVERIYDVGVAGLHRLLSQLERLRAADVIITVAGMDGALPAVVSGLVAVPVVAVPTSTGYGAAFGGVSALLNMLNSCSPGVGVVNIDNGFGAAYLAATILRGAGQLAQGPNGP